MNREEARRALAENLILLAEALLDEEQAGEYMSDLEGGELKITSSLANGTTITSVIKWSENKIEEEWPDIIEQL